MKCTECSRPIRPVAAVDIDGTLGDYHGHFIEFAEAYVGRELPHHYRGGEEFSDYLGIDKRTYRDAKLAYRQGGLKRSMAMFPGAGQFMDHLIELGFEIWITTTRPWLRLDNIDPDTREWLGRNRIPYDGLVYDKDKYQQLVGIVDPHRVLLVVEDLLEQCREADALGLNVVQPIRHHNLAEPWRVQFDSFEELAPIAKEVLESWA